MTTVVALLDPPTIAADTGGTEPGGVCFSVSKVFALRDLGMLCGFSGDLTAGLQFRSWIEGGEKPDIEGDFSGIVVTRNQITLFEPALVPIPILNRHYAIGSGAGVALGYLEASRDARGAVKAAMRWDSSTHGRIEVIRLATAGKHDSDRSS